MPSILRSVCVVATILLAVAALNVFADDTLPDIPVLSQGNVSYISGGVGEEELEAMHHMGAKYNLKMSFTNTAGAYLANVHVTVQDNSGKILLNTYSEGPCLYALLPKGTYKVIALMDNQPIVKAAHLSGKGDARLDYRWAEPKLDIDLSEEEKNNRQASGHTRGCY